MIRPFWRLETASEENEGFDCFGCKAVDNGWGAPHLFGSGALCPCLSPPKSGRGLCAPARLTAFRALVEFSALAAPEIIVHLLAAKVLDGVVDAPKLGPGFQARRDVEKSKRNGGDDLF